MSQSMYRSVIAGGEADTQQRVRTERHTNHAVVYLNEPERLNPLSAALVSQLKSTLHELISDRDIRAIVLTGEGRGFSVGGDLRMMDTAVSSLEQRAPQGAADIWRWIRNEFGAVARLIARSDTAFIAALNGPAAGVALAWALTCDMVIASEEAVIVPAFGRLGLLPEVGTSWALTRALGYQGAFRYYLAGEHIDAQRALELGLVGEVVPAQDLLGVANGWCERIAELPEHAMEMTKPLLRGAADASWESALTLEEFAEPTCFTTGAFEQAVRGMLSK
ncbi:MAG TPA: enoyl-CoA hydratase/isomerase family protein [Solirubrobacteraceae bacterium]